MHIELTAMRKIAVKITALHTALSSTQGKKSVVGVD